MGSDPHLLHSPIRDWSIPAASRKMTCPGWCGVWLWVVTEVLLDREAEGEVDRFREASFS